MTFPCRASPSSSTYCLPVVKGSINPPRNKPVSCERIKQVLIGEKVLNKKIKRKVLVCCEGWPSTAMELAAWVEGGVVVLSVGSTKEERGLISDVIPNIRWVRSFETLIEELKDGLVVFQGSYNFVQLYLSKIPGMKKLEGRVVVIMASIRMRRDVIFNKLNLVWRRIRHGAIGGVTTSCWSLGIPNFLRRFNSKILRSMQEELH